MGSENLPHVGKLLGHKRHRTAAGYAHLADAHLVEATERVRSLIAEAMNLECGPTTTCDRLWLEEADRI